MMSKLANNTIGKGGAQKSDKKNRQTGLFLTIEGTAGAGEQSQLRLLEQKLTQVGYQVAIFDFSRFEKPSSYFIQQYLQGHYGSLEDIDPYTSSLFFTLERYHEAAQIAQELASGKVVIAHRFIGASMAYHGLQFARSEERRGYFLWLQKLEFERLKIPRPTLNLVLRLPAELANNPVNFEDLHQAVEVYDDICQLFSDDFRRLDVVRSGQPLDSDSLAALIWQTVEPFLPVLSTKATGLPMDVPTTPIIHQTTSVVDSISYYTPPELTTQLRQQYQAGIKQLTVQRDHIVSKLRAYAAQQPVTKNNQIQIAARLLQPIASLDEPILKTIRTKLPENLTPFLKKLSAYSEDHQDISLTNYAPKNELDVATNILYESSNLSLKEIAKTLASWNYDQKIKIIQNYLASGSQSALIHVTYSWDLLTDHATFLDYRQQFGGVDASHQPLTPRFGYETPEIIEQAGLADDFDACFDASLNLYGNLQAAGYGMLAQYLTLLGHKTRWQLTLSYPAVRQLLALRPRSHLITAMLEKMVEAHPLLVTSTEWHET